jgi:hypothetical protein
VWGWTADLDHVNMTAERILKVKDQFAEIEDRSTGLHLDEQINVTVGAGLTPRHRSENANIPRPAQRRDTQNLAAP